MQVNESIVQHHYFINEARSDYKYFINIAFKMIKEVLVIPVNYG